MADVSICSRGGHGGLRETWSDVVAVLLTLELHQRVVFPDGDSLRLHVSASDTLDDETWVTWQETVQQMTTK